MELAMWITAGAAVYLAFAVVGVQNRLERVAQEFRETRALMGAIELAQRQLFEGILQATRDVKSEIRARSTEGREREVL